MPYTKVIRAGDLIQHKEYQYDVPKRNKNKNGRRATPEETKDEPEDPEELEKYKAHLREREEKRRASSIVRCRESFHFLVRANLFNNAPYLLTLTMREVVSIAEAYKFYSEFEQLLGKHI